MKALPFYCLLLGSGALGLTILSPTRGTSITLSSTAAGDPPYPTDTILPFNEEIRPSEFNKFLHPNATYTEEYIDCDDGEPIVVEGLVIGCFFTNTEADVNRAIEELTVAKNLTEIDPEVSEAAQPARRSYHPDDSSRLSKRDPYNYESHHCFGSGVYSRLSPDFRDTMLGVCQAIDRFAGKHIKSGSWTILRYGGNPGSNMFAVGRNWIIQHDYTFFNLGKDDWVYSSFAGECFWMVDYIIQNVCKGGSGTDSRGGWVKAYDVAQSTKRVYQIGADPNRLGQPGT